MDLSLHCYLKVYCKTINIYIYVYIYIYICIHIHILSVSLSPEATQATMNFGILFLGQGYTHSHMSGDKKR